MVMVFCMFVIILTIDYNCFSYKILTLSVLISGGLVYVTDWTTNEKCKTILVFSKEGKFVTSFVNEGSKEGQCNLPTGLTVDADGVLYVCECSNSRLLLF